HFAETVKDLRSPFSLPSSLFTLRLHKARSEQRPSHNLPRWCLPFIVLLQPMAHKKRPATTSSSKKSTKNAHATFTVKKIDPSKPARKSGSDDSASSSLRRYNIPDYRLEHPKFRIFMSGEGASLEYRIQGDLSATTPPI